MGGPTPEERPSAGWHPPALARPPPARAALVIAGAVLSEGSMRASAFGLCKGTGSCNDEVLAEHVASRTQVARGAESSREKGGSTPVRRILGAGRCRPGVSARGGGDIGRGTRRNYTRASSSRARSQSGTTLADRCSAQPTTPSSRCFETALARPLRLLDYR